MHTQNVNVKTATQESSRKMGGNPVLNNLFNCALPPLRGLDIRIAWGQARALCAIDMEKAEGEMTDTLIEAQLSGYLDYNLGEEVHPGMFSDTPELVAAWNEGWRFAASCDETAHCSCCQSDSGEPCPYHG